MRKIEPGLRGPNSPTVGLGTAFRDEDEPAFVGAMSSVYVREGDGWRLARYRQTQLPDAPE